VIEPSPPRRAGVTVRRAGVVLAGVVLAATVVAGMVLAGIVLVGLAVGGGLSTGTSPPGERPGTRSGVAHLGASAASFEVWERRADGTAVRFDPCSPLEVVLSTTGAPPGARQDLEVAVERLRAVTDLDLRVRGTTDERPSGARLPYQPERYGERWAPVLVAWADPREDGLPLRDIDRGVGIPVAVGAPGERVYVSGQVVLNARRDDLVAGFEDRATSWGATLLHELAHVLGLDHVDDPDQLMDRFPGTGPVTFGDGDLAGLRAVGGADACLAVPTPQPVVVETPSAP
jgi:hypothetical protein